MMAGFDDYGEVLYGTIFEKFGVEATFTPLSGDPFTLTVLLKKDEEFMPAGNINFAATRHIIDYMRLNINRKVLKDEVFTIDGSDYKVYSMASYPDSWNKFKGKCLVFEQ